MILKSIILMVGLIMTLPILVFHAEPTDRLLATSTDILHSSASNAKVYTPIPTDYVLKWNDEFNDTVLNEDKWFRQGPTCSPWYNEIHENVLLDGNGNLVLRATKNEDGYYGSGVATMCDKTGNKKFDFKYGFIEIRAKSADTNQVNGMSLDLWITSENRWPPEIDITESGSGPVDSVDSKGVTHSVNALKMTRHCNIDDESCDGVPEYDNNDDLVGRQKEGIEYIHDEFGNPVDLSKDFHRYGLEWTPTYIRWLLDDVEQFRVTTGVPQEPFYIILESSPRGLNSYLKQFETPFPNNAYIDYVRLYQKTETADN